MKCVMEYMGKPCGNEATWRVRPLKAKNDKHLVLARYYFCDRCVTLLAQYDQENGNQFDGERIDGTGP